MEYRLTYEQVNAAINKLSKYIKPTESTVIIPILDGGKYIGDKLSLLTGLPKYEIKMSKYNGRENTGTAKIISDVDWSAFTNKDIIVVDDILDTGDTYSTLLANIKARSMPKSVSYLTIASKQYKLLNHKYEYYYPDGWVVFPWENYEEE